MANKELTEEQKQLKKERDKRYRNKNKKKIEEREKKYKKKRREINKIYRENNKEKIKKKQNEWRENNKEKIKKKGEEYRKTHPVDKEKKKEYHKQYYSINKEHFKEETKKNRKKRVEVLQDFIYKDLSKKSCVDCGEKNILVLEYDHLRDKEFNVSTKVMQAKKSTTIEILKKEIEKCEVRCSNCHRKKTAKDFNWYKYQRSLEEQQIIAG